MLLTLAALSASLKSAFFPAALASRSSCDPVGPSYEAVGTDDFDGTLKDGAAGDFGISNDGVLGISNDGVLGMSNDGVLGISTFGMEKDGILISGRSGALKSTAGAVTFGASNFGAVVAGAGDESNFGTSILGVSILGMSILGASILGTSNFGMSGILMSLSSGTEMSFRLGTLMAGAAASSLAAFWRSTASRCFSFSAAYLI